jgi:hypothetical protein
MPVLEKAKARLDAINICGAMLTRAAAAESGLESGVVSLFLFERNFPSVGLAKCLEPLRGGERCQPGGPKPQLPTKYALMEEELNSPAILPPMARGAKPAAYSPSEPLKPVPKADPSSLRGNSSLLAGAERIPAGDRWEFYFEGQICRHKALD